jgi:hypothetical protein
MEEQTAWGNIAALADKGGMGIAGLEWEDWIVASSTPSPKFARKRCPFRMRSLNRCRPALGMSTRAVLRIHTATNEGKERTSRIIHTSGDLEHLEQFSGENCSAPV